MRNKYLFVANNSIIIGITLKFSLLRFTSIPYMRHTKSSMESWSVSQTKACDWHFDS